MVAEVGKGPIEGGGTADYEQKLDIPPLPPSNLTNCGIIDLEYNLKVVACVSGWLVYIARLYKISFELESFIVISMASSCSDEVSHFQSITDKLILALLFIIDI